MTDKQKVKLYHKDVFISQGAQLAVTSLQENSFNSYYYSHHFQERLNETDDRSHAYLENVIKKCLSTIKSNPQEAFEIEVTYFDDVESHYITKYCIRIPYDNRQDLCVVIRPIYKLNDDYYEVKDNKIITAWLNSNKDEHRTLNKHKYAKDF